MEASSAPPSSLFPYFARSLLPKFQISSRRDELPGANTMKAIQIKQYVKVQPQPLTLPPIWAGY